LLENLLYTKNIGKFSIFFNLYKNITQKDLKKYSALSVNVLSCLQSQLIGFSNYLVFKALLTL